MKRKFKSVVSVILSLMMIISMASIGFITTNAASTAKIYFDNSDKKWSSVAIWAWDDNTNYTGGTWPGTEMKPEGDNIWSLDLDTNAKYVIFNSNQGNNSAQIGAITLPSDWTTKEKVFKSDGSSYNKDGSVDTTTTYYLGGRITGDASGSWHVGNNYPFVSTDTEGLYKYESTQTPKVWSETRGSGLPQYFFVHTGSGKDSTWYGTATETTLTADNQVAVLSAYNNGDDTTVDKLTSINSTDTSANVTFWLDTNNGMKLYYTAGDTNLTEGAIKLKDDTAVNGSLSFKAEGNTSGTADIDKNVTITANPFAGFTCSGIAVSYTNTDGIAVNQSLTVSSNTASFTVPDVQANSENKKSISFAASFTLDKVSYLSTKGDGLWIDVAPDKEDTTATLIKWNNYYGNNHATSNPYTFYVPKNVDLSQAVIYNAYNDAVTLNGTNIPAHGKVKINLNAGEYTATGACGNQTVKVMQGSTNAMFLYTTDSKGDDYPLPTAIKDSRIKPINPIENEYDKESIKATGGNCTTMTDNDVSAALKLSQVKGRGNSSWGASTVLFGKYAYNMKLDSATALFDLPKSKSFCLLANNADESMLRNAFIYQLADNIGLYDSPEFRFVDIYDNGEYMGQYLITEKVDVADINKLVCGNSIDDLNEDAGAEFYEDKEYWKRENDIGYAEISNGVDLDNNADFVNKYQTTGTYLLEFEIPKRVDAEVSFFKSNQGQDVVLKSPEFATKGEVEFIKNKFNEMENLVYNNASLEELNKVMDLDSFAKMYLIQEFSSNLDAAATSYYITYNCAEGRFVASPVWDYDWALGQYETNNYNAKHDVDGDFLYTQNADGWFAKNKAMGDGADTRKYSLQSKLANNSNFLPVIKKVWTNSFYEEVQKYYEDGGQIDQWYNQISSSVAMNEARWGFIKSNLATGWGSKDTGENHQAAVNYLKNDWSSDRTESLNGNQYINSYQDYTQFATPTLKAYNADGEEISSDVEAGSEIVLKATTPETYVKFKFYDGDSLLGESDKNQYTIASASAGDHNYRVETVYGSSNTMVSSPVSVTASGESAKLTGVSLSTSSSAVAGTQITLKATPQTEGTVTGITYSYYMSEDNTVSDDDTLIIPNTSSVSYKTIAPETANTYYYYVKATFGETTVTSTLVPVEVTEQRGEHTVRVWFKSASTNVYVPSVSLDGGAYTRMTRIKQGLDNSTYFGSTYSGSLKFYWYFADVTLDSTFTHKLTFKTAGTSVIATSESSKFNSDNYYFAVDNLMNDTKLVDLTDKPDYIRNYHRSATHMVYNNLLDADSSLGFTYVYENGVGKEYPMGYILKQQNDNSQNEAQTVALNSRLVKIDVPSAASLGAGNAAFTIESATLTQKFVADIIDVSELQRCLLDVNLDEQVDIRDVTLMQKALAQ